jgi:hypothetical protein
MDVLFCTLVFESRCLAACVELPPFKAGEEQCLGLFTSAPAYADGRSRTDRCGRRAPNFLIRGSARVMYALLSTTRVLFFEPAYFDISLIIICGGVSALALR